MKLFGAYGLAEPDLQLALSGLGGVRAVNEVLLDGSAPVAAEVTADGTRCCIRRVGGTCEGAEALDAVLALNFDGQHRAAAHELNQWLEEVLADVLGVVLVQHLGGGGAEFHTRQLVPLLLNAAQNFATQATTDTIWFDQD